MDTTTLVSTIAAQSAVMANGNNHLSLSKEAACFFMGYFFALLVQVLIWQWHKGD